MDQPTTFSVIFESHDADNTCEKLGRHNNN